MCITKDELGVPRPYLRAWVIELFDLSDDARKLHVNIGVEEEVPKGRAFHNYLASLDLVEKKLELLSPLKDILF